MKALETLHLNDAVGKKNKFNLSRTHLTTMEIGEIMPILHEELIPGDSFNCNEQIFSRLAPLAVPTYGQFMFKTATMFIPYYQVFEGAEAFFSGKYISKGNYIHLPYLTKLDFIRIFMTDTTLSTTSNVSSYDYCYSLNLSTTPTTTYKKFTVLGKRIYKVLRSLGYQIPEIVSTSSSGSDSINANDKLNALPLLCYLKAYNDYMSQSQRYDTSVLSSRLEAVRLNKSVTDWYDSSTGQLSYVGVGALLKDITLMYENDYFTSAWSQPNSPLADRTTAGDIQQYRFYDTNGSFPSGASDRIVNATNNSTQLASGTPLTQRALDNLRSFDNWVRRNNYSGSKDVEKILSRFGIKPEDFKASYSHLLNKSSNIVQVGDVTALSDTHTSTGGALLGDYAGKGIVSGGSGYQFTSSDFGMLITLAWITVKPFYSNGYDRTVLKVDPLDWFNPEFDGLGGNPIPVGEIFVDRKNSSHVAVKENAIFGFNERYDEYKTGNRNQITGDFAIFEDMNAWHFDRTDLKELKDHNQLVAQSSNFVSVNNTYGLTQYNRIFNSEIDNNATADHFYITAQFDVTAFRPMKSLNEVPDLGTGDTVVARNGNQMS